MTEPLLKLRPIGVNDYRILEGEQTIGRLRYTKERIPGRWAWNCVVLIPGPPYGVSDTIEEAKADFKRAWIMFKAKHSPEELQAAFDHYNIKKPWQDEPDRRPRRQRFE